MNTKQVQLDNYDVVELWAAGKCQLRLMWDNERKLIDQIISGPLSLQCLRQTPEDQEPGIVKALREEGI